MQPVAAAFKGPPSRGPLYFRNAARVVTRMRKSGDVGGVSSVKPLS